MLPRRCLVLIPALLITGACGGGSRGVRADSSASAVASPSASPAAIKAGPEERIAETDEFGYVVRATTDPVEVDVDRVDMLSGAEAEAAAAAHGDEVSNDYYLVNDSPRLRRYRVSPDTVVWGSIGLTGTPDHSRVSLGRWVDFVRTQPGRQTLFHFDLEAGQVVAIEEQYRP